MNVSFNTSVLLIYDSEYVHCIGQYEKAKEQRIVQIDMDLSANYRDQMESDHEDMDIEEEPAVTSDDDSEHSDFNPEAESETESKKEVMLFEM